MIRVFSTLVLLFNLVLLSGLTAQDNPHYQTDFSKEEFARRRNSVYNAIGNKSVALLQGFGGIPGFTVFRQANNFFYLTGIETPHAYL